MDLFRNGREDVCAAVFGVRSGEAEHGDGELTADGLAYSADLAEGVETSVGNRSCRGWRAPICGGTARWAVTWRVRRLARAWTLAVRLRHESKVLLVQV